MVTVLLVTYNHRPFIESALDSVLAQRAEFPVEILISEDASTDGTRDVVIDCARKHPERVRLLLSESNVASNEVIARGLRQARGRYLALIDGDDFWCDPGKLQKQVDYLEANPECAAVFHNGWVAEGNRVTDRRWTPAGTPARMDLAVLMEGNPYATCGGLMRTDCLKDAPAWYSAFLLTDWPLYALCALRGQLAFVDEPVGVYRLHEGGQVSLKTETEKLDVIEGFYRQVARNAQPPLDEAARGGCSKYFFGWSEEFARRGEVGLARDCLRRSLLGGGLGRTIGLRQAVAMGARLFRMTVLGR